MTKKRTPLLKLTRDGADVGIVVADLARAERFYGETLGLPRVREVEISGEKAAGSGCAGGPFRFSAFRAGEIQLKLVEMAQAPPPNGGGTLDAATGFRYITFSVESAGETAAALAAAGVSLEGEVTEVIPGRFILFFRDPDGNLLECVGPK